MKTIQLTKGQVTVVDDADFGRLSQHKWYAIDPNKRGYWYAARTAERRIIYMHRELLSVDSHVDHVDGNGLNNQRGNLRPSTNVENSRNQRKRRIAGLSSQFKGVSWHKQISRWRVRIKTGGATVFQKTFASEVAAAIAYDCAAREHFGSFARPNFPYGAG